MADLFLYTIALRVNGQQVRTRTQFESSLPNGKIEPAIVEVKENNDKVEGIEVFNKLVELSGIGKTPEEVLKEFNIEILTNPEGEQKFWSNDSGMLDWFGVCKLFLQKNYHRRWAYVKVGDREIYGRVSVSDRRFKMKTSGGILTMPAIYIEDTISRENQYVFFPISALLDESEQALFEMYRTSTVPSDTTVIEQEIMRQLERLSIARTQKPTISETNNQFSEIEEMCRASGVIRKLYIEDGILFLDFDWRVVMDTDQSITGQVLPPFTLKIDLRNFTVRGNRCYHPHIMGDYSLCMGGRLTDLAHKCINERDLKTLVGAMIEFGNSWTSSDAGGTDRSPADCILSYTRDNGAPNFANIPVSAEDIRDTLEERGYDEYDISGLHDYLSTNH